MRHAHDICTTTPPVDPVASCDTEDETRSDFQCKLLSAEIQPGNEFYPLAQRTKDQETMTVTVDREAATLKQKNKCVGLCLCVKLLTNTASRLFAVTAMYRQEYEQNNNPVGFHFRLV